MCSGGHATYRQNLDDIDACMRDQHMFAGHFVPLQIAPEKILKLQPPVIALELLCQKGAVYLVRKEVNNDKKQIVQIRQLESNHHPKNGGLVIIAK